MELVSIITILCSFGFVPLLVYLTQRHRERKALIESGQSAEMLVSRKDCNEQNSSLKYGLVLVGLAIGILLGSILATYSAMAEEAAYFSMIFLFGGIALLSYYIYNKSQTKDNRDK